jgi:hypothetical protein
VQSINIPVPDGCGDTHSRPEVNGVPVSTWELKCDQCEPHLRGDRRQKKITVIPGDKELMIPDRLEHVPDGDPMWSNTPDSIPMTPDEARKRKIPHQGMKQQVQALQDLAAMNSDVIPEDVRWVLSRTFT